MIWDASTDPDVVGYNIYYGAATRSYTNRLSVGASTTVTIHALVPGVSYFFAATSQNAVGKEGPFSREIVCTLPWPAAPQLPSQPDRVITGLTTLSVTNTARGSAPMNTLEYQLLNPPAGASINSNGIITWTPTLTQSPSTNLLLTVVTDNSSSPQSATNSFVVVVRTLYHGVDLTDPAQAKADWDGDGLSNLAEYALGSDPTDSSDAQTGVSVWLSRGDNGQYLMLRFKQRVGATIIPLQYVPEVSGDGRNWYSDGTHLSWVSVVPVDFEFNEVTVRDLTAVTVGGSRYIRVRIVGE